MITELAMSHDVHAHTLLERIPMLRHPCDLDLLAFFARHPRTLLASEQLARLLGYHANEIARSLDVLLAAGLLTRTQSPVRAARMYVFATAGSDGECVTALVALASTREGRLALRRVLVTSPAERTDRSATQGRGYPAGAMTCAAVSGPAHNGDDHGHTVGRAPEE